MGTMGPVSVWGWVGEWEDWFFSPVPVLLPALPVWLGPHSEGRVASEF